MSEIARLSVDLIIRSVWREKSRDNTDSVTEFSQMATNDETSLNMKNFLLIWIILVGAGMTIDIRLMSEVIGGSLFDGDEMGTTTSGGIALGVGGVIMLLLAWLADKIGRRWCLLISLVICSLGNLFGCAMPNYLTYVLIMIVSNTGLEGICLFSFII